MMEKRRCGKQPNEKGAFKLQVSVNNPIFNNKPFNTNNLIKEIKKKFSKMRELNEISVNIKDSIKIAQSIGLVAN